MNILAFCFSCGLEHDISKIKADTMPLLCKRCGGFVITPSGKAQMQMTIEDTTQKKGAKAP